MSRLVGKPTTWFPNRSDTNRPVQLQKQARSLKFWRKVEEELYYPRSENKDADQLRGYREADLRLCFRLCRLLVFPRGGSYYSKCNILIREISLSTVLFCKFQVQNSYVLLNMWASILPNKSLGSKYTVNYEWEI